MNIKTQVNITITDDSSENYYLPLSGKYYSITDLVEKDTARTIEIAGGSSDIALGLGNVNTLKYLILHVSGADITVKINDAANFAIPVNVYRLSESETKYGVLLLTTSGITELYLSNSGSDKATIKVFMAA